MAEQQLIDYIKKAREAGQSDDQSRSLLYKNGWTEAEVKDAFTEMAQPEAAPQSQPQPQPQPKMEAMPQPQQPEAQPQPQVVSQPRIESQPQTIIQSQPAGQSGMPRLRTRSHLFLKLLMVLIIVIVLAGVGLFVAGQYINLPWNLFGPSSSTVVSKMLTNMENLKVYHTVMQGDVSAINSNKVSQGELSFNITGDSDTTDASNPKADGMLTVNLTPPGPTSSLISLGADLATIDGAFYFKIDNATLPSNFSYPGLDISKIISGGWLKIDQDSIKALSQMQAGQVTVPVLSLNSLQLVKQIQDLLLTENALSVSKQLNDQVVGGQDTYHYLVTINNGKLKDLVGKIMTSQAQNGTANASNSSLLNMAQPFANAFIAAAGDIDMEMWIGKKDYMLYEVKLDKSVDVSKIFSNITGQAEVKLDITNTNFNKPISIQVPIGAQKVENIILPLLKTQKVQSDMNQVGGVAAMLDLVNKSYYSICRSGLLNGSVKTYGPELTTAVNDIIKQGAKNPICFSNTKNYCVSTQLSDGSYLCTSQSNAYGVLGEIKCISPQTVCK